MVVSHNDIYSHRLGQFNGLVTRNPIIHCHNQGNPLLLDKIFVNTGIGSITVGKTIGQINRHSAPSCSKLSLTIEAEVLTIRIIVSIDEDIFPFFNGLTDPFHCLIHIMEQIGVMQVPLKKVLKLLQTFFVLNPLSNNKRATSGPSPAFLAIFVKSASSTCGQTAIHK